MQKVVVETLIPGIEVASGVIDIWASILNNEESLRDRVVDKSRIFCSTDILVS